MNTFEKFGLAPELLKAIAELGFETPTDVQSAVIPRVLESERDLIGLAQTGTGKTAAFGLPILHRIDRTDSATQAVVLCPTRELCMQITKDLANFSRYLPGVRVLAVYGGSSIVDQIRALSRGVHILVATPGRMNDLLRRGRARLGEVRQVVLDEADEMLNMGFKEDLETILKEIPEGARTLLFSATMPRQVAAIAGNYMDNPEEILVGVRNAGAAKISHVYCVVHERDRYAALKRLVDAERGMYGIVFCRTRVQTQEVAAMLMADGYRADALHGDLTQQQRDRVMRQFRDRTVQLLVATDVAARGLDVNELTHVVHYTLPDDADQYNHRSGRTARAGRSGISIALANAKELYKIKAIERALKNTFERRPVPSSRDVCFTKLTGVMEEIQQTESADARLKPFMPALLTLAEGLSREELVHRFVLRECGRLLDYYQDAPDLNVRASHTVGRPEERGPDRGPVRGRKPRPGVPESEFEPAPGEPVRVRVNLGLRNQITPAELIGLINRATPGPMLRLGRIRIEEQVSVFDVMGDTTREMVRALNRQEYGGRAVRAVAMGEGTECVGPGEHEHRRGLHPGRHAILKRKKKRQGG